MEDKKVYFPKFEPNIITEEQIYSNLQKDCREIEELLEILSTTILELNYRRRRFKKFRQKYLNKSLEQISDYNYPCIGKSKEFTSNFPFYPQLNKVIEQIKVLFENYDLISKK